jgi:hypothetical protein
MPSCCQTENRKTQTHRIQAPIIIPESTITIVPIFYSDVCCSDYSEQTTYSVRQKSQTKATIMKEHSNTPPIPLRGFAG